jgi:hypothetical protein
MKHIKLVHTSKHCDCNKLSVLAAPGQYWATSIEMRLNILINVTGAVTESASECKCIHWIAESFVAGHIRVVVTDPMQGVAPNGT